VLELASDAGGGGWGGERRECAVLVETEADDGSMEKTFKGVSKEELFKMSDVVSLHHVLSKRSRGMVGSQELDIMKKLAFFIDVLRGHWSMRRRCLRHCKEVRLRAPLWMCLILSRYLRTVRGGQLNGEKRAEVRFC